MERLIVYETDKGNYAVRPEQWTGIIDKNGRIKECGLNHTAIFHYKKDAEWYADAKNAEEQGLLLRLPVPCGEWVYSAECGIVAPYIVASYSNDKHGLWCLNVHGGLIGLWGTSVFKTHKEAEQALAKIKEV